MTSPLCLFRPLLCAAATLLAGCTATPKAEIKPAKSAVKTDRSETPPSRTRSVRTRITVNTPVTPKKEKP